MADNDIEKDYQALKDDIALLKSDMSALLDSLGKGAKARSTETAEQVEESARKLGEKAEQTCEQLKGQYDEKPLLFLLGSFTIGLLLGQLFSSRK